MQYVFQVHAVICQILRDIGQPLDLSGCLVPGALNETRCVADDVGQILQRGVQVRPAVVYDAGQRGEPVLELHDLFVAVTQGGDERLQIGDGARYVTAAVGQDPSHPGQLCQRLA